MTFEVLFLTLKIGFFLDFKSIIIYITIYCLLNLKRLNIMYMILNIH